MALSISFTTTFNRTIGSNGVIVITDTTDYAAQGYSLNVNTIQKGYLRVSFDTGSGGQLLYDNLTGLVPDAQAVGGVIVFSNPPINIPLDTNGKPLPASYTITYRVEVVKNLIDEADIVTQVYEYSIVDPLVCLEAIVNCNTSALSSTDATNYTVAGATIDSLIRAHTLYPPPTSGLAQLGPVNLSTILYSPIATTTWTSEIITTVQYTQADGLIVLVQYEGSKEIAVVCDNNLNTILCCLVGLQREYEALECTNPVKAANFKSLRLDPTLQHLTLFLAAQQAGNYTKASQQYAAILAVSGCSEDCGCTNTPEIVQVSSPGGNVSATYIVDSPNGTIQVITNIAGNVTTFSLDISPGILNALANITTTVVSTSTPNFLTVAQVGFAPTLNYQVDLNSTGLGDTMPRLTARIELVCPGGAPYATAVGNLMSLAGSTWNVFANATLQVGQSSPNVATDISLLRFQNFLTGIAVDYVASADYMDTATVANDLKDIAVEVHSFNPASVTGDITFRIYNPSSGQPYTLSQLATLIGAGTAYITINLFAKA